MQILIQAEVVCQQPVEHLCFVFCILTMGRGRFQRIQFVLQLRKADGGSGIFCGQPDDDIAQFAGIAGKAVLFPALQRLRVQFKRRLFDLLRIISTEMGEQQQFVLPQFAQRRDQNREYIQAVIQVAAECAGFYRIAQIAVGCGDDARPALARFSFADTLIFAVFQHSQQLGLEFQRQLADLVKEQCALCGIFKKTGLCACCTGEGALAVTEQGGFDQCGGNGGAVERLEWRARLASQFLYGGSHQLLAATRFSFNQHGERNGGIHPNLVAQGAYGRTLPDDAKRLPVLPFIAVFAALKCQRIVELFFDFLRRAGLGNEIYRTQCACVARVALLILSGQSEDLDLRRVCPQFGNQAETLVGAVRDGGETQVNQCHLRRGRQLAQQIDCCNTGFSQINIEIIAESHRQSLANQRVVVNDHQAGT